MTDTAFDERESPVEAAKRVQDRHERPILVIASEPVRSEQQRPHAPEPSPTFGDIAQDRLAKLAERRAHALSAVSLAMEAGNHPRHCWSAATATAAWSVAELLIAAMDSKPVELAGPLRQSSPAEARAKAEAVAKALAGGGA